MQKKTYGLSRQALREEERGAAVLPSRVGAGHPLPRGVGLDPEGGARKELLPCFQGGCFRVRFPEEGKVPERSPPYLHPKVRARSPRLSFRPCRSPPSPFLRRGLPIFLFRLRTIVPPATSPSFFGARTTGFGLVSVDPTNTGRSPPCQTHPFPMSFPSCVGHGWKQAFFSRDRN